ncbi:MAG: hypothetical protein ACJ8FO_00495, partial [Sphingomicrobium sp.]
MQTWRYWQEWVESGHSATGGKRILWIARGAALTCEFASLIVVLLRHPVQYKARPLVDQTVGQLSTVVGLAPKLLWRIVHQPTRMKLEGMMFTTLSRTRA